VALSLALALGLSQALFSATASALTPTPLENQLDAIVYSPTAAELFWPRAATGTEYFVTENVAGLALDAGSTAATSLFLSDLEPATAYEFTVSFVTGATLGTVRLTTPALDGTGSSVTPVGEGSSDETLPDVRLRGEVYSPSAIELFWDRVGSGETRSNMITVIGPDGTQEFANTGSSLYLDDLQPDTSYEFAVVTSHFGGVSVSRVSTLELRTASLFHVTVGDDDVPPEDPVVPDEDPPTRSLSLTGEVYSSTALELFWEPLDEPALYRVTLLEGFGSLRGDATEQSVFNARSFYVDDLRPGTGYRFEVVAIDVDTGAQISRAETWVVEQLYDVVSGFVSRDLGLPPLELTAEALSATQVRLSWNAIEPTREGSVTAYEVVPASGPDTSRTGTYQTGGTMLVITSSDGLPLPTRYRVFAYEFPGSGAPISNVEVVELDDLVP
jgi:hypothetical protein